MNEKIGSTTDPILFGGSNDIEISVCGRFRALWSQLCKTETDFRTRCKDRIKRQLEIGTELFNAFFLGLALMFSDRY